MPGSPFENIGVLVRQGILLFAHVAPIPAPSLVAAIGAAAITKILEVREERISEALSLELSLSHISYLEPDDAELINFYSDNPIYAGLAQDFAPELQRNDNAALRRWYPYLYA